MGQRDMIKKILTQLELYSMQASSLNSRLYSKEC